MDKVTEKLQLDTCGIDIFTYIDQTTDYADNMYYSLTKNASQKDLLRFNAIVRYGNEWQTDFHHSLYNWCTWELYEEWDNVRGSMMHGIALNHINAIHKITKLHNIILVIDADIYITYKGWDDVVRTILKEHCCFGFNRHDENFPSVFFFAFKKPILSIKELDFKPDVDYNDVTKKTIINSAKEAKYRCMDMGSKVKCDTGFQLPLLFKGCGFGLDAIPSTSSDVKLPHTKESLKFCTNNMWHMSEYHFEAELFGTHKQACRNHRLNNGAGKLWLDRIQAYERKQNV